MQHLKGFARLLALKTAGFQAGNISREHGDDFLAARCDANELVGTRAARSSLL